MAYVLSFTYVTENIVLHYKNFVSNENIVFGIETVKELIGTPTSIIEYKKFTDHNVFWDLAYNYLNIDENKMNPQFNFINGHHILSIKVLLINPDPSYYTHIPSNLNEYFTLKVNFNIPIKETLNETFKNSSYKHFENYDINENWQLLKNTSIYKSLLSREKYVVDNKLNTFIMFPPWEIYTDKEPEGGVLQIYESNNMTTSLIPNLKPDRTQYKIVYIPYDNYYCFEPLQEGNCVYYFKKYLKVI